MEKALVHINVSHVEPFSKDCTVELNKYVSNKPAATTLSVQVGGSKFVHYFGTAYQTTQHHTTGDHNQGSLP